MNLCCCEPYIVRLFVQVGSVFTSVHLRKDIRYQRRVVGFPVTVSVVHPKPTPSPSPGAGPRCDGPPRSRPAPPTWIRVNGRRSWRQTPGSEQLRQLQGQGASVPSGAVVSGQQRRGQRVVRGQWVVGRVGQKGLLLWGVGVRVRGAAAVDTKTASDQRSATETVAPPTQAVGTGPGGEHMRTRGNQRGFLLCLIISMTQ